MARGRHQKWICKDCKGEFSIQGSTPKFCCSCGSANIGRAPSYELALSYDEKRKELAEICTALNPVFREYTDLRSRYDAVMAYWRQQRTRGYISREEYDELAQMFDGSKVNVEESPDMAIIKESP